MMVVVVPVSISASLGTAEGGTSTPGVACSGGATITSSPTPIFGSNCPIRHDIGNASQRDEDLCMMRIVGYSSKGQPGGGLVVPECPAADVQVGFTAAMRPGHLSKKIGPLCWLDLLCHRTVLLRSRFSPWAWSAWQAPG